MTAVRAAALLLTLLLGCSSSPEPPACLDCLVLHDVTVIDGRGNPPVPGRSLLIRDGQIVAIEDAASFTPPPEATVLDLPGRFVMPGLIDLHAHVTILPMEANGRLASRMDRTVSEDVLRTLVAFGITTVRNPAAPTQDGVALREAVASRSVLGPTIQTAGAAINLRSSGNGPGVGAGTEAAIRAEVQRQADQGVDWIKLYSTLSPDLVQAAIDEAHRQGLRVVGHLQRTTWTEAAQDGIDGITHGAPWSAAYLPKAAQDGYRGTMKGRLDWLEAVDLDGPAIREMIQVMADSSVSVDPTLIAYRTKFWGDDPHYLSNPDSVYAPFMIRDMWRRGTFTSDWSPDDYARGHAAWPTVLGLTRRLYEGGVLLTAGSDFPNPWVIPGVSLHEELLLLHSAGIPTLEVLQIATYNGAVAMGLEAQTGSVEVGKEADLLVLTADPVADLANTRAIEYVVMDGTLYHPDSLTARAAPGRPR